MRITIRIRCHFRQELGTCVDFQPTSIVPTLETSLRVPTAHVEYTRTPQQADIFGIKIDGQRLTLSNLIGAIRHASYIKMYTNVVQAAAP